jgi:hypothetical protein
VYTYRVGVFANTLSGSGTSIFSILKIHLYYFFFRCGLKP